MEPADLIGARGWQGRCARLCAENGAIAPVVRFVGPARPLGARVVSEVRQQCLIKSYARKYTTFVQYLHIIMCLPMCVAVIDFNVLRFALENTQKRFEKQSDSSSSYTNCNVFL